MKRAKPFSALLSVALLVVALLVMVVSFASGRGPATSAAPDCGGAGCIVAHYGGGDGQLATMTCTNCTPPRTVPVCVNSSQLTCEWVGFEPCCGPLP